MAPALLAASPVFCAVYFVGVMLCLGAEKAKLLWHTNFA